MTSRVSIPLTICIVAFGVAGLMLLRSPAQPSTPAPEPVAEAPAQAPEAPAGAPANEQLAAADIGIADFAFNGQTTVSAGQTINVANADGAPHTLTAVDGSFDTGILPGGASGGLVAPSAPGTYAFFCSLHPSMTGTLTVN